MRLYIIRHADPNYERDILTPRGHREAQALATYLAAHGLDQLYSSPLGRAVETAQYTAELLHLTPTIEDWTRELSDGLIDQPPWGLMQTWEVPGELIRATEPFPTHTNWHLLPPFQSPQLQETFQALQRHSDAFLERHGYKRNGGRYRCVSPHRDKIAVFCHYGFGMSWLAHLLELPLVLVWSGFWMAPSSVTTILFEEWSSQWAVPRCIGLGDVSHLHAAGLQPLSVGLGANFH